MKILISLLILFTLSMSQNNDSISVDFKDAQFLAKMTEERFYYRGLYIKADSLISSLETENKILYNKDSLGQKINFNFESIIIEKDIQIDIKSTELTRYKWYTYGLSILLLAKIIL